MTSAAVVIHFEDDEKGLEHVTVSGHRGGQMLDPDELQWQAFRALPHLERTAWTTEESRSDYHMQHAYPAILERLYPEGGPMRKAKVPVPEDVVEIRTSPRTEAKPA